MSFVLGLTGSIGMGKSTTAGFFRQAGVPVWDADAAVHRLYSPGGAAVEPVRNLCPEAITEDGAVDRTKLKQWIAADSAALARLEAVVHPLVAQDRAGFLRDHISAPLVVLDIPLLFETGGAGNMDAVLVVSIDPEEQRRRVLGRGAMTEEVFQAILARQLPDAEKRQRADYVIETKTLEQTEADVRALIAKITGKDHA